MCAWVFFIQTRASQSFTGKWVFGVGKVSCCFWGGCLFFKRECHRIMHKWTDEQILWLGLLDRHRQYLWSDLLLLCQKIEICWLVLMLNNVVIYGGRYHLLFSVYFLLALCCSVLLCLLLTFWKGWCTCHAVTPVDHSIDQYLSVVVVMEFLGWCAKSFLCLSTTGKTNSTFFFLFFFFKFFFSLNFFLFSFPLIFF